MTRGHEQDSLTARSLVVLGARPDGGVRGVLEIARLRGCEVVGLIDDHLPAGPSALGCQILGGRAALASTPTDHFVVAVGHNGTRRELFQAALDAGLRPVSLVHPTAWLSPDAAVAAGAILFPGAIVSAGTRAGSGLIVNTQGSLDHDNRVGDFVNVSPGAHTGGRVTLEDEVFLGIGVSVLPDVVVGAGAMVGAGAVVVRDAPAGCTLVGVPARATGAGPNAGSDAGSDAGQCPG